MPANWRAYTLYSQSISKLLRALKLDESLADLIITERGVKIQTTAVSRSFNGHLFLPKELFTTYEYEPEEFSELSATLSLPAVVSSLRMVVEWQQNDEGSSGSGGAGGLGKSSVGCFFLYVHNKPLQISFVQGTMQTTCDLTVYDREDNSDEQRVVMLDLTSIQLQVITAAEVLTSMLADLEAVSTQTMTLTALEYPSRLHVHGQGLDASVEFTLPVETDAIETMVADPGTQFSYDFRNLGKCRDIAKLASRVSLRCDSNGTLSIQCQCDFENTSCYVEFRFLAYVN